jgi:predicted RNA binding protein YcfA (HicA-like mRNA interferase family)
MTARELIRKLEQAGWIQVRVTGGHYHFKHPARSDLITVPMHRRDLKTWLARAILKQAGLIE